MRETRMSSGAARSLWRFRAYGRPHLRVLWLGIGLRIGEMAADLAQPWPLAIIVDTVVGGRPLHGVSASLLGWANGSSTALLTAAVAASLLLALGSGLCDYLGDRIMNGAGERMTAAIRGDLFAHLQRLPLAFHDRIALGELTSRLVVDTDRIDDALVDVFSTLLPGALTVSGLLAVTVLVDWRLGLITLAGVPVVLLVVARYTRLTRAAARARRAAEGNLSGQAAEVLVGIRTVLALGSHDVHDQAFAEGNRATLSTGLRSVDVVARFTPLVEVAAAIGAAGLLWAGTWGVLHGAWTLGVLLVVMTYVRNLLKPLRSLSRLSLTLAQGAAAADRVGAVLSEPLSPAAPANASPAARADLPRRARGDLELRHVDLDYGRGTVLRGASLRVAAGERVALVGPNGVGKSSVVALLAGLYHPTAGMVSLDGRPLRDLPAGWLRDQLAVVPQETVLFSGTLAENIGLGRPGASVADIRDAADRALVLDFARDLPQGLDTLLGDRGSGLSGGQRQRVAIARALLRDAPVVLLDEPTSDLDPEAERVVVRALRGLVAGRTVVMVTHRPALLDLAQRVLTVEGGDLVDAGDLPDLDLPGVVDKKRSTRR
ncbi:MAG TPA: ABC transporter ATP-binding protein [Candidatus Dormibacteraeota bacterium]|nr:ABC transporter ATP-binding protein [Candidatus Dormibacteraeota bacterium]